ncbi:MAG: Ig-like domain-containing protein, partial [Actinomycetes bacterium]
PAVLVTDANNNPVSGVAVTFAVASGGGSVIGGSTTTNASGIATVGSWTLGTVVGANTMTATNASLTGSPLTFTATGLVGAASKYVVTSSGYSPIAGAAVTVSAQLADQYGNAVATNGITVTWTKSPTTSGSFASGTTSTNSSGVATVVFTTGTTVTTYAVTATSSSGGARTGTSPNIVSVAGAAKNLAVNAGAGQSATVGTAVTTDPAVLVTDTNGNPVSGVTVTFAVASGGGSVIGGSATTNASGIAAVGSWTLGTTHGTNTLTATVAGLTGSPLTFTATGATGAAAKYVVASNDYSVKKGTTVTITAQLTDQYGNEVTTSGTVVTWTKTGTGGSFASNTTNTNSSGIATVVFTVSSTDRVKHVVTATSAGGVTGDSPEITTTR